MVIILKKQNQNLKILNTNQINFLNKNFNAEININNNNNNKNNSNLNLKNPTNISKKGTFNKTSNNKDIKKKPSKLTIKRKNKK